MGWDRGIVASFRNLAGTVVGLDLWGMEKRR